MKIILLIAGILLSNAFDLPAQDAKAILKKTYDKCQTIQNGYYNMTRYMKYMTRNDTSKASFNCYFKKLEDDSLYSSAFHYKSFWDDKYEGEVLYTGNDFLTAYIKDSTATIMSKALWANKIKSYSHNYEFYSPFTDKESSPLPGDSAFLYHTHIFKFIEEENLNNTPCYHIQVNEIPENDSTEMIKFLRNEYHYLIKKADFIPIQYSIAYDLVMNNDTMYQYEKKVLNDYEINNLADESILNLNSIPAYYTIKDFIPYENPKLLPKDTIAPYWELL